MRLTSTCSSMVGAQLAALTRQQRSLRVAASFCRNRVEALRLMALLACHPGLRERQLALLSPADAAPDRFAACRQRWDRLRPSHVAHDNPDTPVPLVLAGAMLGALSGLVLGTGLEQLADLVAVVLVTALAGGVLALWLQQSRSSGHKHRRFDQRLQRRLAQGRYAVVLLDVDDESTSLQLLQAMRRGGVGGCAEVPLRRG